MVALEGGYNLDGNANCMEAVTLALLEEPFDCNNVDDGRIEQQRRENLPI